MSFEIRISASIDKKNYLLEFSCNESACKLVMNSQILYSGEVRTLSKYIHDIERTSPSDWFMQLRAYFPSMDSRLVRIRETPNIMIFRSFYLCFRGIPLDTDETYIKENLSRLSDHFWTDYNGQLGSQPAIYFVPQEFVQQEPAAILELFEISFLFKLELMFSTGSTVVAFFVPFNLPAAQIKSPAGRMLWQKIVKSYDLQIRNFVGRR